MARLAARRLRLPRPSGPSIEHSARRDPSGLGGQIGGREEGCGSLDATEFLLESSVLLPKLSVLLLQFVRLLQALANRLALLRVEGDRFIVIIGGEQFRGVLGVHLPL